MNAATTDRLAGDGSDTVEGSGGNLTIGTDSGAEILAMALGARVSASSTPAFWPPREGCRLAVACLEPRE
jgi:hypothetical protein